MCLSSEIRGSKFRSIDMIWDPSGVDIEVAMSFQRLYAQVVCDTLKNRLSTMILLIVLRF